MKVQSNIHAGMTQQECQSQRDNYKHMVQTGACEGQSGRQGACTTTVKNGVCTKTCPYPPFTMPC
jgi:hypothetical protein